MKNTYNKPRITSSKKACTCSETGNLIKKWETVLIVPTDGIKIYCKDSKAFSNFTK